MSADQDLRELLLEHELQRTATLLASNIQSEVRQLKQHLEGGRRAPRLSQVRSLANALAPLAGTTPAWRLARLHELVAGQLQRRDEKMPTPITQPIRRTEKLPASFWSYVAGRLMGLRSGDWDQPGEVELFWRRMTERYALDWPAHPDAGTLARIHLRLAEALVYHLIETWEYTESEVAQ